MNGSSIAAFQASEVGHSDYELQCPVTQSGRPSNVWFYYQAGAAVFFWYTSHMSKGALYFIIIFLVGVIFYLLFVPQQTVEAPVTTPDTEADTEADLPEPAAFDDTEPESSEEDTDIRTGTIEFTGELVGFGDGKDQILGSYKTALINDGIEILSIDLRPVVGYDVTNLESDLGITIGEPVTVYGKMDGDTFVITDIE